MEPAKQWTCSLLAIAATTFVCLFVVPPLPAAAGTSVVSPGGDWGIAAAYNRPSIDLICAGRFVGQPKRLQDAGDWDVLGVGPRARFAPLEAEFQVDSVVLGPQGLVGQTVPVRYAVLKELLPDGPAALAPGMALGSAPYRDVAGTVGGRRCLLVLQKGKVSGAYFIYHDVNFMVAGVRPQVAGWAGLTAMERLECEFASAVKSPDPAVAYLATLSSTEPYSRAVGPDLIGAIRQNAGAKDRRLQAASVAGLLRLNDLDTVYGLKETFQRWQQDPQMKGEAAHVGGVGLLDVTSRNAVPALVELSTDPDPGVRWGATYALRRIGGEDAVAALAGRLYDESVQTRYQAIQGLASALKPSDVGAKDWSGYAPAVSIYENDPDTPVDNWKSWWVQKGKGHYPSVEAVVTKAERFRKERPWARKEPTAK